MEGFYLLVAHLVGDYILQNDWMAANKTTPHPGPKPEWGVNADPYDREAFRVALIERDLRMAEYPEKLTAWHLGNAACAVHCLLYTLAVWAFSWWWMPAWGLLTCFIVHYALDRYRLARLWMTLAGQEKFATGALSPWSIVVVDNTFHLLTLAGLALACHPG